MREIKFRVYIKKTKEMLPVVSIVQMNDEEWLRVFPQGYDRNFLESEWDIIIMQYTWLNDENGKEIYEGDMIITYDEEWNIQDNWFASLVIFKDCCFHLYDDYSVLRDISAWWGKCEIIGNRYENPELVTILIPKSIYVK